MNSYLTTLILVSLITLTVPGAFAQEYTAQDAPLPEKLAGLPQVMEVVHYPPTVHAIETEPGKYYWKHNTTVYCETSEITIKEFGSFLFYENKWNERVAMDPKDMDKLFGTAKGVMNQAEPYTFTKNWRGGGMVFGGWAMWYFIGVDAAGREVCGYGRLETTDVLLQNVR